MKEKKLLLFKKYGIPVFIFIVLAASLSLSLAIFPRQAKATTWDWMDCPWDPYRDIWQCYNDAGEPVGLIYTPDVGACPQHDNDGRHISYYGNDRRNRCTMDVACDNNPLPDVWFPECHYVCNPRTWGTCINGQQLASAWDICTVPFVYSCTDADTVQTCQVCGNGYREGTEQCDSGGSNGTCPSTCSSSCTTQICATTVDLKANGSNGPVSVSYDTPASLSWTVSNATSCTASGGWSGSKSASGSSENSANITENTTFNISCTGPGGTPSDSVTATIVPPPTNPTYTCAADGTSATISWTKAFGYNQVYLRTRNPDGSVFHDDNFYTGSNYILNNITPNQTYTWYVHTKDLTNDAYSDTVSGNLGVETFKCVPTPTLTFNAVPPNISKNDHSDLTWTSTDVTSCWASGDWTGWKTPGANMTESTGSLDSDKTYNLECWNDENVSTGPMTANVHVWVCRPPDGRANSSTLCVFDGDLGLAADTDIENFDGDSACNGKCEYKCSDPTAKYKDSTGTILYNCNPPKDGVCENDATKKTYCQKPTANLCDTGEAIDIHLNGDHWEWNCNGEYGGGESTTCSAVKSCSFKEVAPN